MASPRIVPFDPRAQLEDMHVSMSNALTRAAHSLSLAEKRLIAACIGRTDQFPMQHRQMESAWTVRVTAAEYAELYNLDMTTAYEQLKAAGKNLFSRYIRLLTKGRRGMIETKIRWVGRCTYHDGEGWVEVAWFHEVVPHLFGLRQEFTSYMLRQAKVLRSIYSWRLFEVLHSWADKGRYAPTIEEFARAMDVPEKYTKDFKQMRTRVIEPAVTELVDKNNMQIEWEAQRAGRKVVGLTFHFQYITPQLPGLE